MALVKVVLRGLVLGALALGFVSASQPYRSNLDLWTRAVQVSPLKPRPWVNLAVAEADSAMRGYQIEADAVKQGQVYFHGNQTPDADLDAACRSLTTADQVTSLTAASRSPYTLRLVPTITQLYRRLWHCDQPFPQAAMRFDAQLGLLHPVAESSGFVYEDAIWRTNATAPGLFFSMPLSPRWLTEVSYRLDARLHDSALQYHLTNLLIHLLNVGLVLLIARRVLVSWAPSLLAATIFAIHPMQSEAIWYLSARGDLLMAFGILLACYAVITITWPLRVSVGIALLGSAIALLSKEQGVVVLLLLPLIGLRTVTDWTRWGWPVAISLAGMACAPVLMGPIHMLVSPETTQPPIGYAAYQAVAFFHWLTQTIVPLQISLDPDVELVSHGLALGALLLVMAASGAALVWRRSMTGFALGFALLACLPRFLVRLTPEYLHAHQWYVPMIGLSLALGSVLMGVRPVAWKQVWLGPDPHDFILVGESR